MIISNFGATPGQRVPFQRPAGAGFYTPRTPSAAFQTHINPFTAMLNPMASVSARLGPQPSRFQPAGMGPSQTAPLITQMPQPTPMSYRPGFQGARGFGSAMSPYRALRTGMFPGVMSSGSNIRAGVNTAGQLIRQLSPASYPQANVPAGGY